MLLLAHPPLLLRSMRAYPSSSSGRVSSAKWSNSEGNFYPFFLKFCLKMGSFTIRHFAKPYLLSCRGRCKSSSSVSTHRMAIIFLLSEQLDSGPRGHVILIFNSKILKNQAFCKTPFTELQDLVEKFIICVNSHLAIIFFAF